MKNLVLALLCLPLMLFSQDQDEPSLFEVVNIHVKQGMEEAFEAAVKAHDTQYHPEGGLYRARLFYNLNGPTGGTYSWIMGPTNWTAMDSRPGKGAHDDDWAKVEALVEKFETPTYWSFSTKLSHAIENVSPPKRLIWMYDVKSGQRARFSELVGKVKEVYTAKRPTESLWVVWNEFADSNAGMDVALIFAFDKWAWMDRNSDFGKEFEEVHGSGSWHNFLNEFGDVVDGRVDWLREQIN
jgi:hypothetical protein